MITLSLISNTRTLNGHPAPLSKTFELTHDGVLTQTNSAKLLQGLLEVKQLPIDEAIALIDTLKPHQALCVGVPKNKATQLNIVTSAKYDTLSAADRKHTIPRTTEHIIFSSKPCLMVLDIDSNERCKLPESVGDLADILFAAIPCLDKTDLHIRTSTSSNIYNTKTNKQLRGVGGYHVFISLRDGFEMKAIGELLEQRLWLDGKGYIKITKDGRGFASTMLDSAVWEPTRLIYNAAGCGAGLDQRKDPIKSFEGLTGSPDGYIGLCDFDTLTHSELARVAQLKQDALALAKPEMKAKRDAWLAAQIAEFMLANPDATEEEIARAKKGFANSEKELSENHIIEFTDNRTPQQATVATIKANPNDYHGRECKDPMEPDYRGGAQVGKLYLKDCRLPPYIHSRAHGGQTFNLYSQAEIELNILNEFYDESDGALSVVNQLALMVPLNNLDLIYHPSQINFKKYRDQVCFAGAMGTVENLSRLVKAYDIEVRYNQMSKHIEVLRGGSVSVGDLSSSVNLSMLEDLATINKYPPQSVMRHFESIAQHGEYHPARDWVLSKPWDGVSRTDLLFQTLTLKDQESKDISSMLFRKWCIGAAAILTGAANKFESVLILVDTHGGAGKTRWFESLCPSEYVAGGVSIDVKNVDSIMCATSHWIVELGEIDATFKKSDIAGLKAFLSKSEDEYRRAYGRATNKYKRRTAFGGSVNQVNFLADETNNRRFFPIEVSIVNHAHGLDMQQVWAEFTELAAKGEIYYLTSEENLLIGNHNQRFKQVDPIEEKLLDMYSELDAPRNKKMTATEIAKTIGYHLPTRPQLTSISANLTKHGFTSSMRGKVIKFHMPSHYEQEYLV